MRQGIFQYNGIVNERNSWKSEDQAIWFYPRFNDWAIGSLSDLGTNYRGIATFDDQVMGLFKVPNNKWMYWDGYNSDWVDVESSDITFTCL